MSEHGRSRYKRKLLADNMSKKLLKSELRRIIWKVVWTISPSFRMQVGNKHRLNELLVKVDHVTRLMDKKIESVDKKIESGGRRTELIDKKIDELESVLSMQISGLNDELKEKTEDLKSISYKIEGYERQNELESHIAKNRRDDILKLLQYSDEEGRSIKRKEGAEYDAVNISIICLIYRSTKFAKAVHDSLYNYTPELRSGVAELLFVANDANEEVLKFLKKEKYNYLINDNEVLSEKELFERGYGTPEYINRVYRGYNYGIKKCKGEIIVLINSDNMFSPNWLENLLKNLEKNIVVCSQLVERHHPKFGVFPTAIQGEFGSHPDNYLEKDFLDFTRTISRKKLIPGGAYMPCMSYKNNFKNVGYYPEGNIAGKSFDEVIQYGDENLYEKLLKQGVMHTTACDSVVYHFKEGERED